MPNREIPDIQFDKNLTAMVVDIGTMFIKYSLFAIYEGSGAYLIRTEHKDMNLILQNNEMNYNLLKRDIERKVTSFSDITSIDMLIVIPQKSSSSCKVIPRFEYYEDMKIFKQKVKDEAVYLGQPDVKQIFDWAILDDNAEEDYRSILIDSISEDVVFKLNEILVNLPIKEYKIVSPLTTLINVTDQVDNKARVIIDFGHRATRISVVKRGVIYATNLVGVGGHHITEKLLTDHLSYFEAMRHKHEEHLSNMPNTVNAHIEEIIQGVSKVIDEFSNSFNDTINEYIVVGGSAQLELEMDLDVLYQNLSRVYPKLRLVHSNDMLIPNETRNYIYGSLSSLLEVVKANGDTERLIDFSASKSGGIGMKVKEINHIFNRVKPVWTAVLGATLALSLTFGISKFIVDGTENRITTLAQQYETSLTSYTSQLENVTAEYDRLNRESIKQIGLNTGKLLKKIQDSMPYDMTVVELDLIGEGTEGTLKVRSESQVALSAFVTVLQEEENGAFTSVKIQSIRVINGEDGSFYETVLTLTGRKI